MEARLQWPHGLISGSAPPWQAADDAARQQADQQAAQDEQARKQQSVWTLGALALAVLTVILGILFWIWRWYRTGRDPAVGPIADYLNDPPSDLPAGMVGFLLDEGPSVRDVIATILDLGKKGNLRIDQVRVADGGLFGGEHDDFQYTLLNRQARYPHEQRTLDALFDSGANPVRLSDLKNQFYTRLDGIYREMGDGLVQMGYFPATPDQMKGRNRALALLFVALAIGSVFLLPGINAALLFLAPAFGLVGIVGLAMSGIMPRKTQMGAEQAARWRAFARYMADLQRFGNVGEAAQRFGDYLPYAVALGVDQQYTRQFEGVQGTAQAPVPMFMPTYYVPWGWSPGYGARGVGPMTGGGPDFGGGGGPGPLGGGGMPDFSPGGINAMNRGITGAIEGLNTGLTSMINDASSIFTSQPAPSGGGGGGGGWSGGWSGGGGGGFGGGWRWWRRRRRRGRRRRRAAAPSSRDPRARPRRPTPSRREAPLRYTAVAGPRPAKE